MTRIAGYVEMKQFVEQNAVSIASATGKTAFSDFNKAANAVFIRFKRHASQAGGADPIAYISYDGNQASPGAANSIPVYDGDDMWVWPEEIANTSVASSDANQPTLHYVLWLLG